MLSRVYPQSPVLAEMLAESTGSWVITPERIEFLSEYRRRLSPRNMAVVDELLGQARNGARVWVCTGEIYAAMHELQVAGSLPTRGDAREALERLLRGADGDRIGHREWVKEAAQFLRRISEALPD